MVVPNIEKFNEKAYQNEIEDYYKSGDEATRNKNATIVFNIRSSRLNSIESESEPDDTTEPGVNLSVDNTSSCDLSSLNIYT